MGNDAIYETTTDTSVHFFVQRESCFFYDFLNLLIFLRHEDEISKIKKKIDDFEGLRAKRWE